MRAVTLLGTFMVVWIFALPGGVWGEWSATAMYLAVRGYDLAALRAPYVERPEGVAFAMLTLKHAPHVDVRFLHHFCSGVWAILAPAQLSASLRQRWPNAHRLGGRLMALLAVPIMYGYVLIERRGLTFDETFGGAKLDWHGLLPLRLTGIGFMVSAAQTWRYARRRELSTHARWARRYVALGMWVALQRILLVFAFVPLATLLLGREMTHPEARSAFALSGFLGVAACACAAELANAASAKAPKRE